MPFAKKREVFSAPRRPGRAVNAPRSRSVLAKWRPSYSPLIGQQKRGGNGQVRGMKAPDIRRSAGDAPRVSSRVALFAPAMSFLAHRLRQSLSGAGSWGIWAVL